MRALRRLRAALLALALAAAGGVAVAQSAGTVGQGVQAIQAAQAAPDYAAWDSFASRAEAVIANPRTTSLAIDTLRGQTVSWRSQFQAAQSANKSRIETLQQQIAALGPPPAEGATEAPEIAQRRTQLTDQLSKLQAPGLTADEAYSRADGIVREIDNVIRQRQAQALMHLSPSPLFPTNWPAALDLVRQTATTIAGEVRDSWAVDNRRADFGSNLPLILGYIVAAVILLARGARWFERGVTLLRARVPAAGQPAVELLASLSEVVVPFLGVLALYAAVQATGLIGLVGTRVLGGLPAMGFAIFTARWLGGQIFPRDRAEAAAVLPLDPERRAGARLLVGFLGILIAVQILRYGLFRNAESQDAAIAVLTYPIIVLGAVALFRLGRLLRPAPRAEGEEDELVSYRERLAGLLSRAVRLLAVGAILFGAAGYIAAATAAVFRTALTLALIGLLLLLQRLIESLHRWIARLPAGADSGLIPILLGFAASLLALPLFALIWGARVADLGELWSRVGQGFSIGSTRISPANFLTFAILFGAGYGVTRLLQGALKTTVLPKTRIDKGGQNAIVVGTGYLGYIVAALVAITGAGIDLSGLALVASALTVGIGFGLQNIVSNFVSGVILLIERPVSEGDWIDVGGVQGTVRSISVRSTRIETFDRADVIVPNSNLITGTVTNMTKFSRVGRLIVPVGVAYGTDTRKVDRLLREIAEAHPLVVLKPAPQVVFQGFGADSLDFEIRVILRDVNFILDVKNEMNHQIAEKFAAEGIEIPFAQRDIWLRNPEALRTALGPAAPAAEPAAPAAEPAAEPAPEPPPATPARKITNRPEDDD